MKSLKLTAVAVLACALGSHVSAQSLSSSDFQASPLFTENFAGGSPTGQWELDPSLAAAGITGQMATFQTSTPSGIDPSIVALDPVASAGNGAAMMMGNDSSTVGTDYGLNYMRVVNTASGGSGTDLTTLEKYRVVARIFLLSPTEISSRWQVGPYAVDRPGLYHTSAWHNTASTGGGPGFGVRGVNIGGTDTNTDVIPGTSAIASARWTLMSVMVDITDADAANWKMAATVDANGDGTLDESDPLEYYVQRIASDSIAGPPGIFAVGDVAQDTFPLFVDWVEVYEPAPLPGVSDWMMY